MGILSSFLPMSGDQSQTETATGDSNREAEAERSTVSERVGGGLKGTPDSVVGQTLVLSAVFYLLLAAIYFAMSPAQLTQEHILIALIPFVILLVASDKIEEIRAPGGLLVTLRNEGLSEALPEFTAKLPVGEQNLIEKHDFVDFETEKKIRNQQPAALTFELERGGYYRFEVILQYIEALTRLSSPFRYIVFVGPAEDSDRTVFKGFMDVDDFRRHLDLDFKEALKFDENGWLAGEDISNDSQTIRDIESGAILDAAGTITTSIPRGSTTQEALQAMHDTNETKLAVVDDNQQFLGVLTQDRLARGMLLKLFRESRA